ncbi:MAG: glycerol-3-phosphate acyltransferase [Clostridiales bacterium]|nr:glycerol-3-phosphate acyltransferase [Clostridiales bacterium]
MRDYIIVIILGYLFGNVQAAYLLGKKIKKVDIRTLGHGNAGASNAVESLGKKFGFAVLLIDMLKGIVSILLVKMIFNVGFDSEGALLLYLNGYSVILGHIFPFYMNFKGGKGTASMAGILLGLNIWIGLLGMLIVTVAAIVSDYIIIGTLALTIYIIGLTVFLDLGTGPILISVFGALLSLKLHLPNYKRIFLGTEGKVSRVLKIRKSRK